MYVFLQSNKIYFVLTEVVFTWISSLSNSTLLAPCLKDKILDETRVDLSALLIHTHVALQATSRQFYILTLK